MATTSDTKAKLLKSIAEGNLDRDLDAIREAIIARINVRRTKMTIKDYPIGSKVRFNELTANRSMVGKIATVVGHKVKNVSVTVDDEKNSRPGTCPISILDLIS